MCKLSNKIIYLFLCLMKFLFGKRQPLCSACITTEWVNSKPTVRSRWAGTHEAVDEVDALSSIEAGLRVALVNIILTVHPLVPWFTLRQ